MLETVIEWDGTEVPRALRQLPPGRYVVTPVDDLEELTEEEDAGIRLALDEAEAGLGLDIDEVMREMKERIRENKWN